LTNPQLALVTAEEIVTDVEPLTVIEEVVVQFTALVTVIVYVPAASADMSSVVNPLFQIKV
jgi:hypothetical protein